MRNTVFAVVWLVLLLAPIAHLQFMSAHPNNTVEQKAKWQELKKVKGSAAIKIIPSDLYRPEKKAPSRRDTRRAERKRKP